MSTATGNGNGGAITKARNRVAEAVAVQIKAPNFGRAEFRIRGVAPLVQNKFSQKALGIIREQQAAGGPAKNRRAREPKDFQALYEGAMHRSAEGWYGFPAGAFRNAMISACRVAGYPMTKAKLSIFVEADGYDANEPTPLVRITRGEPSPLESAVRNDSGVVDIRSRAMWAPGWEMVLRLRWDGDQFTTQDVANLLLRAGLQVGIGEGRPDSKDSAGMGWGLFEIVAPE